MNEEWRNELVTKGTAVDALKDNMFRLTLAEEQRCEGHVVWDEDVVFADVLEKALLALPSAQPQLEICPIYGGMCGYPSNLCYECPRHEGAKERPQWWTEGLQPFAQPQRRKGKWIHDGYDIPHGVDWMHCSVCGRREPHVPAAMTKFCPTCGSDMRGE